jgi:hypothetical protein
MEIPTLFLVVWFLITICICYLSNLLMYGMMHLKLLYLIMAILLLLLICLLMYLLIQLLESLLLILSPLWFRQS